MQTTRTARTKSTSRGWRYATGGARRYAAGTLVVACAIGVVADAQDRAPQDALTRCGAAGLNRAVRCLLDSVPAAELEEALFVEPRLAAVMMPVVADALLAPDSDARLPDYLVAMARARTRRLSARGSWTPIEGEMCLRLQLVDAGRFAEDSAFRARVLAFLPRAFDPAASPALRDQLLTSINTIPGIDYATSETIEWGWGAIPRRSLTREVPYRAGALTYPDDVQGEIAASIYSFPGPFLEPDNVTRLMAALQQARPGRDLIALADLPMRAAIARTGTASGWTVIETHGREFSPWPRDPFGVLRRPDGGVALLVRPNTQAQRPADNDMALELIQGLPARLDAAWGEPVWSRSPVPFHNGQVLLMPGTAWISIHTVSPRALEMLGTSSAPADNASADEWARYRTAVLDAAGELAAIYRRPVKFVHAIPETAAPDDIHAFAGGGGYDLDSLVTLLPQADGSVRALVADVSLGSRAVADAGDQDLAQFASTYGLTFKQPVDVRNALTAMQQTAKATALDAFLDRTAAHLGAQTAGIERVPLLFVAVSSVAGTSHLKHDAFQITWNNVVLEEAGGVRRAEGFASGLDGADRDAKAAFARAGYQLDYLPVLPESVILLGGYRCASQHVRLDSGSR